LDHHGHRPLIALGASGLRRSPRGGASSWPELASPAGAPAGTHDPAPASGATGAFGSGAGCAGASCASAAACWAASPDPSPKLDHELRLQDERVGSIAAPAPLVQIAHDQLERAQLAAIAPTAVLHEERVQLEMS